MTKPIVYEPHPVSPERKAELLSQGVQIVDAIYAPPGAAHEVIEPEDDATGEVQAVRRGRPPKAKE